MEHVGSMVEGEWSCSLNGMYNTTEEADFMAQLLANPPLPCNLEGCTSLGNHSFWPESQESVTHMTLSTQKSLCSSEMTTNPNMFYFLQESCDINSGNFSTFSPMPTMSIDNYFLNDSNAIPVSSYNHMAMEFCDGDRKITSFYLAEENECINQEKTECSVDQESLGKKPKPCIPEENSHDDEILAVQVPEEPVEEHTTITGNPKRPRNAEKNKRTVKSRRNKKLVSTQENEEENNAAKTGHIPSACCSDDESNASQEHEAGPISPSESSKDQPTALNSNGKSRASRGTATDPQSLYARKRRERINERLRILQGLVPNGTKVDISTMLGEAVQYVKFLQVQIKLLSSDDMWMYAPIAYNGMNIGLDLNIPTPPKRP